MLYNLGLCMNVYVYMIVHLANELPWTRYKFSAPLTLDNKIFLKGNHLLFP